MPKLSDPEIEAATITMNGWQAAAGKISKTYEFETYLEGLVFAIACGRLAEKRDHHPDMLIGYRKVEVELSTHSEGGVTEKDINLAREFDGLI